MFDDIKKDFIYKLKQQGIIVSGYKILIIIYVETMIFYYFIILF